MKRPSASARLSATWAEARELAACIWPFIGLRALETAVLRLRRRRCGGWISGPSGSWTFRARRSWRMRGGVRRRASRRRWPHSDCRGAVCASRSCAARAATAVTASSWRAGSSGPGTGSRCLCSAAPDELRGDPALKLREMERRGLRARVVEDDAVLGPRAARRPARRRRHARHRRPRRADGADRRAPSSTSTPAAAPSSRWTFPPGCPPTASRPRGGRPARRSRRPSPASSAASSCGPGADAGRPRRRGGHRRARAASRAGRRHVRARARGRRRATFRRARATTTRAATAICSSWPARWARRERPPWRRARRCAPAPGW